MIFISGVLVGQPSTAAINQWERTDRRTDAERGGAHTRENGNFNRGQSLVTRDQMKNNNKNTAIIIMLETMHLP
jgi:hypothetical protein